MKFLMSQHGQELKWHMDQAKKWKIIAHVLLVLGLAELAVLIIGEVWK